MKKFKVLTKFVITNFIILMGCALQVSEIQLPPDECIELLKNRIESRPVLTGLKTLDGQEVNLDEFFQLCLMNSPSCALPDKFYYWNNEVKFIVSKTLHGPVVHKIRLYHNYLSTCRPDLVDPQKTHGDIAEFYNENGQFMGLAVYRGDGLYYPLPYSKYKGIKEKRGQNLIMRLIKGPYLLETIK
jgi:hypothetical protein